jgi:hypothetical protein
MLVTTEPLKVAGVGSYRKKDGQPMTRGDGSEVLYLDVEGAAGYRDGNARFTLDADCPPVSELGKPGAVVELVIDNREEPYSYPGTDRVSYKVKGRVVGVRKATATSGSLTAARAA